jgi:hypothetical protein
MSSRTRSQSGPTFFRRNTCNAIDNLRRRFNHGSNSCFLGDAYFGAGYSGTAAGAEPPVIVWNKMPSDDPSCLGAGYFPFDKMTAGSRGPSDVGDMDIVVEPAIILSKGKYPAPKRDGSSLGILFQTITVQCAQGLSLRVSIVTAVLK